MILNKKLLLLFSLSFIFLDNVYATSKSTADTSKLNVKKTIVVKEDKKADSKSSNNSKSSSSNSKKNDEINKPKEVKDDVKISQNDNSEASNFTIKKSIAVDDIKEINRLTLVDVVNLALNKALKIEQSELNIKIAEHEYKKSLAAYYPEITIGDRFQSSGPSGDMVETNTPSISLSYLLFDFGGREATVRELSYKLEAVKYNKDTTVQDFVYSVIEAYYNLFIAIEDEKAAIETETASEAAFDAASLKYKLGLVPKTDKLKAETSYSQSQLERQKANNAVKTRMADLNYLLRMNPNDLLELATPEIPLEEKEEESKFGEYLNLALKNRPEILSKQKEIEMAKATVSAAKAARYPSISATASASRPDYINDDTRTTENNYAYGINITMPLFTGFKNSNEIAKTKRQLDYSKLELEDLERNIKVQVWDAYHNFQTAKDTLVTSQKILKSAVELEKTTFGMYKNGKASMLDLIDAQSKLADAKKEVNSSKYGYFIAKSNLLKSIGKNDLIEEKMK